VTEIASLAIGDAPERWAEMGFVVTGGAAWISGIRHEVGAAGAGVVAWTLRPAPALLTELPVAGGDPSPPAPTPPHPNGVIALDHVVVATPDLGRTVDAFVAAGLRVRRTREIGTPARPMRQAFFRLGPAIVEVVGPVTASGSGAASFYGLAFTVADLDATAAFLGGRLEPAIDAVQPGRRIATLARSAGSTVPMAFMSPDPRRPGPG
jgi:hypothetical protein